MRLLCLTDTPILEQLHFEEALLRADKRNWCLIGTESPPAIVMGISGKPHLLIDLKKVHRDKIPLIRRFTGGGTVYIDSHTVFVTLICNVDDFSVPAQPKSILKWSEKLYQPLFEGFQVRENDYVFGERKFGGNAQYIQKGRWLHHTSFLWDYDPTKMEYLLLPQKRPQYRQNRSHKDFLCTLRQYYKKKESLIHALRVYITNFFNAELANKVEAQDVLVKPHRRTSEKLYLNLKQLQEQAESTSPGIPSGFL